MQDVNPRSSTDREPIYIHTYNLTLKRLKLLVGSESFVDPLPSFIENMFERRIEPVSPLPMYAMSCPFPLDQFGLRHACLHVSTVIRIHQVVFIPGDDEHLRNAL